MPACAAERRRRRRRRATALSTSAPRRERNEEDTARRTTRPGPAGRCRRPLRPAAAARRRRRRIGERLAERRPSCVIHAKLRSLAAATSATPASVRCRVRTTKRSRPGGDDAGAREREGAADRRMSGHRQFLAGREDPHAQSVSGRSAGSTNVVSEKFISLAIACIVVGRQTAAVEDHRELIAAEQTIGEDVEMEIPV